MKTVTIEELLSWAFVHELPKGGGVDGLDNPNSAWRILEASSWGKIRSFAELLTVIDNQSGDRSNFFIEQGEPHEDAIAVGEAVAALGAMEVVFGNTANLLADWNAAGDAIMAKLIPVELAMAVHQFMLRTPVRRAAGIVSLVVGTAILGRDPDWSADEPKVKMVERGGKPAWFVVRETKDELGGRHRLEVDGWNLRTRRAMPGAYRKHEFSTSPRGDILSRIDWQVWVAALRHLTDVLRPRLIAHRLVACDRSMTPWLEEDRGGVMLLPRVETRRENKFARAG